MRDAYIPIPTISAAEYATVIGLLSEDLDEIVHEFKAEEAAIINNDGLTRQVEYLATAFDSPAGLYELLEDISRTKDA